MTVLGGTRSAHFIGVGGSGMSPLAELLLRRGLRVSGSDLQASAATGRLTELGLEFRQGHDARHVGDVDVVVRSSAVAGGNPEIVEASRRGIPIVARGELLAELMRPAYGIAVAGAHGKTTTTSMIGWVLDRAGLDPTVIVGGRIAQFGSGARVGREDLFVAEADESDRSFLRLWPSAAVITNVDREHLDTYASFEEIERAFAEFAGRVPFYGRAILCADDPSLRELAGRVPRAVTYALDDRSARLGAVDVELRGFGSRATVVRRTRSGQETLGVLTLGIPGRHNVANALAATAMALELGVPFATAADALAGFRGTERRFERKGEARGVTVVDDYGHHPTEIAAVLRAARAAAPGRVVCVFQPHRYTRTAHLMEDFGPALALADEIVLTDIYAAGEPPLPGVTLDALAASVRRVHGAVTVVPAIADLPGAVAGKVRDGDLVITLGAGSIGTVGPRILEALR